MAYISKKTGKGKKIYSGQIEKEILDWFKAQAEKEDRSVSSLVNRLLKEYIKRVQEKEKDE